VSLRLHPLEHLFKLLSLQRYYLVIIIDLLHLLNLLPLSLRLCLCYLFLELLPIRKLCDHISYDLVALRSDPRGLETKGALFHKSVNLADLLLVDDLLESVLVGGDLLVDDLGLQQVV